MVKELPKKGDEGFIRRENGHFTCTVVYIASNPPNLNF